MTRRELRDHYAGLTLQGLVSVDYKDIPFIVDAAYNTAEAMLAERDKRYGKVPVKGGTAYGDHGEPMGDGE